MPWFVSPGDLDRAVLADLQLGAVGRGRLQGDASGSARSATGSASPGATGSPAFTKTCADAGRPLPDDHVGRLEGHVGLERLQGHGHLGLARLQQGGADERHVVLSGLRGALTAKLTDVFLTGAWSAVIVNVAAPPWGTVAVVDRDGELGNHRGGDRDRGAARVADCVRRLRLPRRRSVSGRARRCCWYRRDRHLGAGLAGRDDDAPRREACSRSL